MLAWLFVAGDSAVPITDDVTARVILLPQNPIFRNAAAAIGKPVDSRAEACRKILARWISRDVNAVFVSYNLFAANQYNLKEGLPSAIRILKAAQTTPDVNTRIQALLLVGKLGGKEHIALLEPLLNDEFVCYDSGGPANRVQTQIRDIALCTSIKLAGQDPKKFGLNFGLIHRNFRTYIPLVSQNPRIARPPSKNGKIGKASINLLPATTRRQKMMTQNLDNHFFLPSFTLAAPLFADNHIVADSTATKRRHCQHPPYCCLS